MFPVDEPDDGFFVDSHQAEQRVSAPHADGDPGHFRHTRMARPQEVFHAIHLSYVPLWNSFQFGCVESSIGACEKIVSLHYQYTILLRVRASGPCKASEPIGRQGRHSNIPVCGGCARGLSEGHINKFFVQLVLSWMGSNASTPLCRAANARNERRPFKKGRKVDLVPFAEAEEWLGCFCLNGGIFEVLTQLGWMPGKPAPMATLGVGYSDEIATSRPFATHVLNKIHGPVFVVTLIRRAARPHSLTTLKAALGRLIFLLKFDHLLREFVV